MIGLRSFLGDELRTIFNKICCLRPLNIVQCVPFEIEIGINMLLAVSPSNLLKNYWYPSKLGVSGLDIRRRYLGWLFVMQSWLEHD